MAEVGPGSHDTNLAEEATRVGLLWTKGESTGKRLCHRYVLFHQVGNL